MAFSCVQKLKTRYPFFSSSQIAGKIGVAQSTFSKVENGTGRPTLRTLSRLLSATGQAQTIDDVETLLEGRNGGYSESVANNLSHVKGNRFLVGDLAEAFACAGYAMVLLLASTNSGTTREEVRENHGSGGIVALEEMIRLDILKESGGVVKSCVSDQKEPFVFDHQTAKDILVRCIREKYDPDKYGSGRNWLSFQTESVDVEKATGAIRAVLKKAYLGIEKILRSPEYGGDGKMFIGIVADSLTDETAKNDKKKEELV